MPIQKINDPNARGKTVKDLCGLDSMDRRKDGSPMSHDEKYSMVVNHIGLRSLTYLVPATREEIIVALESDRHLNNIPLKLWDNQYELVKYLFVTHGITQFSLSCVVCTLKRAAVMWAEEEMAA